jgi:hypothetical protein
LNIKVGVLKINSVSMTSSVTIGTHISVLPLSFQKANTGVSTAGDGAVIKAANPVIDPDTNDHPVLIHR